MAGGGSNKSSSKSVDLGTNVWGPQQGYLKDLWGQARQQNQQQGSSPWDTMSSDLSNRASQTLQQMQDPSAGFKQQMDMYSKYMGQKFGEEINPQIKSQAMLAGGFGGSRQQIGQGLAAGKMAQQMSDFAGQQWQGNQDRALQAANSSMALADFSRQMPWYGLNQYAGILGAPVMQDLGGSSKSKSSGWNASIG